MNKIIIYGLFILFLYLVAQVTTTVLDVVTTIPFLLGAGVLWGVYAYAKNKSDEEDRVAAAVVAEREYIESLTPNQRQRHDQNLSLASSDEWSMKTT